MTGAAVECKPTVRRSPLTVCVCRCDAARCVVCCVLLCWIDQVRLSVSPGGAAEVRRARIHSARIPLQPIRRTGAGRPAGHQRVTHSHTHTHTPPLLLRGAPDTTRSPQHCASHSFAVSCCVVLCCVVLCCVVLCCVVLLCVSFAVKSFHATFPLLEKSDVNGPATHPVFAYLKSVYPGDVTWNFHGLFVINEDGIPIRRFFREPYPEIDAFIGAALDERDKAAAAGGDNAATA